MTIIMKKSIGKLAGSSPSPWNQDHDEAVKQLRLITIVAVCAMQACC